jgi:hypothetical protein
LTTLDIFHDCNRIAWYWAVSGLPTGEEVRGMSLLYTIRVATSDAAEGLVGSVVDTVGDVVGRKGGKGDDGGKTEFGNRVVNMLMSEFNGIAWRGSQDGAK